MLPIFRLEQIEHDLRSEQQAVRGAAMQRLHLQAKKDRSIHAAALPIFRAAVETEQDPWTATTAARGIETIAGPAEGHKAWRTLLNHPKAEMATRAALSLTDVYYVPMLLGLLDQRPELLIRTAVLRTLGRMRDPVALPAIVAHLASPELRPDAIQALADLGDTRAIAPLESFLHDTTELWEEDNHGPMLRVCDLANTAIFRLRAHPDRQKTAS